MDGTLVDVYGGWKDLCAGRIDTSLSGKGWRGEGKGGGWGVYEKPRKNNKKHASSQEERATFHNLSIASLYWLQSVFDLKCTSEENSRSCTASSYVCY